MSDFNMQYLKREHFSHRIQFYWEKVWFFWEILKKIIWVCYLSKLMPTTCLHLPICQIWAKQFQNWVSLYFGKVLKLKDTKGELIICNCLWMADNYLLGRWGFLEPPPGPIRVKQWSFWNLRIAEMVAPQTFLVI